MSFCYKTYTNNYHAIQQGFYDVIVINRKLLFIVHRTPDDGNPGRNANELLKTDKFWDFQISTLPSYLWEGSDLIPM